MGLSLQGKSCHVVQLHGDLESLICTLCPFKTTFDQEKVTKFQQGDVETCPKCTTVNQVREATGKRSVAIGYLRPNIVLYNEHHKNGISINLGDEIATMQNKDAKRGPDMLFIMGTSLKIIGVKRLIKDFSLLVKDKGGVVVFVNLTPPPKEFEDCFDYHISGKCDDAVVNIMDEFEKMNKEKVEKKQKREQAKLAKQQKLAREMAATTPITQMLKLVKKVAGDDVDVEPQKENNKVPSSPTKKAKVLNLADVTKMKPKVLESSNQALVA